MSWISRLGQWIRGLTSLGKVQGPYKFTDPALVASLRLGGYTSGSGAEVTPNTALSLSAIFAGVNLYSLIVASLPLQIYRQRADGKKDVASDLRAYRLLHTQPNPEMTAMSFRRAMEWNRLLGGMAYAEITWDDDGQPIALWPIEYWRVKPDRDEDDELYYRVDGSYKVAAADMLAIPLITSDGLSGWSFLDWAVESLGLGITAQEFAGAFFRNGARPGGYLHNPNANIDPQVRAQMRAAWERQHSSAGNNNVLGMTWGAWEFKDLPQQSAEQAQLLQSRQFLTEEVARWLNIPPHLLRDLSRATFSNIGAQQIDFLTYSLNPVLIQYEQEYDRKLLIPPSIYSKHRVEGFLRADPQARADFYTKLAGIGGLTINQILELEDLDPIGPLGDQRFVPANWQTLEAAARRGATPAAPAPNPVPYPKPEE